MRLDDLAIKTQTPLDTDKVLFEKFRTHDRVEFDPKTNLYSFKVSLPYCPSPVLGPDAPTSMTTVSEAKQLYSRRFSALHDAEVASPSVRLKSRGRMHQPQLKNSRKKGRCLSRAHSEMARCVWYFGTSSRRTPRT